MNDVETKKQDQTNAQEIVVSPFFDIKTLDILNERFKTLAGATSSQEQRVKLLNYYNSKLQEIFQSHCNE